MYKLKKIITMCFAVLMLMTATVAGTMAFQYATADDFAQSPYNRIGVELIRQRTSAEGVLEEVTDFTNLMPTENGYIEDIIRVNNTGNVDTYNRILIAVPTALDGAVELVKGDEWKLTQTLQDQLCEGESCTIYIFTLSSKLEAGDISDPAVHGIRMNAMKAGNFYTLDGKIYDFSSGLKLRVYAQAVQSFFLQSPEYAFAAVSLSTNPWAGSTGSSVDQDTLQAVINTLPTGTDITGSVTDVVFGTREAYADIMASCYGQAVDKSNPNGSWAYYQASIDGEGVTTWTVYILSDSTEP